MSSHMSLDYDILVHGISSVFLKSAVLFAGYDTKIFSFIFFFGSSELNSENIYAQLSEFHLNQDI